MTGPEKVARVAELEQEFIDSVATVLTGYRGLTVKDLQDLRRSLGGDATYAAVRNTLALLAAREVGIGGIELTFAGLITFTLIIGDTAKVTKRLHNFAKAHPFLATKGDIFGGKLLDAKAVLKFAGLGSREVLLSKMAGAMEGSLAKATDTLTAPLSKSVRLLGALQNAAEENPDLTDGAGLVPATETTDEGAAAGDVTSAEKA